MVRKWKRTFTICVLMAFLIIGPMSAIVMPGEGYERPADRIFVSTTSERVHEELTIDLEYGMVRQFQGPEGVDVRIEGLDSDPKPDAMSLPMDTFTYNLPVGSSIEGIELGIYDLDMVPIEGPVKINPPAIPNDHTSGPLPASKPHSPPEKHINWDLGTGIDMDTYETKAILSIKIHPVIPDGYVLRALRSGSIRVDYSFTEPMPLTRVVDHDMLIITANSFVDTFYQYRNYRNSTGTTNVLVTLEDISSDLYWEIEENDTQEEIKRFIYLARQNWGVDFVMIGGDQNVVPTRHVMVMDGHDDFYTEGSQDGRFVASDLYFSDIYEGGGTDFCGWNDHRTGDSEYLWGESTETYPNRDGMDLYPDVLLGRIPASTAQELETMLDKIMQYEVNAKDSVWFNNATLCGTDTFTQYQYPEGEIVSELIANNYLTSFNITKHYESLGNLSSIANTVDKGCGFFEMADHGTYSGWGYTGSTPGGAFTANMAYNMDNYYMLPVVVLDACLASGFDNENASSSTTGKDPVYGYWYYPPGSSASTRDSMAEKFHQNTGGGGIVTFGATRVGWGISGYGHPTSLSGFMNSRFFKAYSDGYTRAGELIARAETEYLNSHGSLGTHDVKTLTEYVLLGDPSLNIGGINSTNARIELPTDTVSGLPGENITVDLTLNNTGILSALFELSADPEGLTGLEWDADFSPGSMNLLPGTTGPTSLRIRVPDMALNTTYEMFTLKVSSDFLREDRSVKLRVNIERTWGMDSAPRIGHIQCDPDSQIWGYADIENLGNGNEQINVTMINVPEGWNFSFGEERSYLMEGLIPYDKIMVTYLIKVPSFAVAGNYSIGIIANSTITPASSRINFSVLVLAVEGLLVEVERSSITMNPEETRTLNMTVFNTGNSERSYSLEVHREEVDTWDIHLEPSNVTVQPFSKRVVPLTIHVPEGALSDQYQITISVSGGNLSREANLLVDVNPIYRFRAFPLEETISLNQTSSHELSIGMMNLGNKIDRYDVSRVDDGGSPWSSHIGKPTIQLGPQATGFVRVDIFNMEPLNGTYSVSFSVSPGSGGPAQKVIFVVVVEKVFNFTVKSEIQVSSVDPGGMVQVIYRVRNLANCQDVFSPSYTIPRGWEASPTPEDMILGPGEEHNLRVNFTTPEDGLAGIHSIHAHFVSAGLGSMLTMESFVSIIPRFSVVWKLEGDKDQISIGPGQIGSLVLGLKNTGNTDDWFEIRIIGHSNLTRWLSFSDNNFPLAPGEEYNITISIAIPSNATSLEYPVMLLLDHGQGERSNLTFRLKLVDPDLEAQKAKEELAGISVAVIIGVVSLLLMIAGFLYIWRKGSGVDVEEAGMEWNEDEDDWDDEDYDELDEVDEEIDEF